MRIYFNSQNADLAGFLLMTGEPGFLMNGSEELEKFYMQAAVVVDDLSLKMMVGGEERFFALESFGNRPQENQKYFRKISVFSRFESHTNSWIMLQSEYYPARIR